MEKKSSLAWFKLHDSVSHNKKEQSFLVHRLLTHSYSPSFKLQILGDLYHIIGEKDKAQEAYKESLELAKLKKESKSISMLGKRVSSS